MATAHHAEHLRLLQRLDQVRVLAEEIRLCVSGQIEATARTFKEACEVVGRARADAVRLVSAAQTYWEHDQPWTAAAVPHAPQAAAGFSVTRRSQYSRSA